MSRRHSIALLAALVAILPGCRREERAGPASAPASPVPSVRLAVPEKVRHTSRLEATGVLKPRASASLAFAISGTVQRVLVRRGQVVAEGTPLVALDADSARAAVAQAEAALAAARAQARLAEDAFARSARMRAQEGISESQYVQAEAQRDLARAQAQAAEAALHQARVHLDRHVLKAPFAGVVTRVPDGPGGAVSAATATPVASIESTGVLTLETALTQEEAAAVRVGDPVTVVVAETGARSEGASVRLVLPSADAATGRVPVEVVVPNPEGRLLAHAFARATFAAGAPRDAWKVPAAALTQRDGAFAAWAAGSDRVARTVPVKVLEQQGSAALVDPGPAGWPAGLEVVLAPPLGIAEGARLPEGAGAAP